MKITTIGTVCPVLCAIILAVLLLLFSCGRAGEDMKPRSPIETDPAAAHAIEVTGFSFEVSPPDTVSIKWSGEGSAVVTDVYVSSGQEIHEGDTLFKLLEDLHIVERERLVMELDLASAMLFSAPSDTVLQKRVDSLNLLVDSLLTDGKTPYRSPLDGTMEDVHIRIDDRVRPGNSIAEISVESSQLFYVIPPSDCTMNSWPSGRSDIRFVEERVEYAVYSGELNAIIEDFSEFIAVPREAVYESNLDSYLITVEHDTIFVIRAGMNNDNLVIVLPGEPVISDLLTWSKLNGETF